MTGLPRPGHGIAGEAAGEPTARPLSQPPTPSAPPDQAAGLMAVLALEERDRDVFVGSTPRTSLQRIFGGQVAGQALMAAGLTAPPERGVHSLHAYFLRPGDPRAEIRYTVERIRDGRSFASRRVLARQWRNGEEVAIFALIADFHAGERAVVRHSLPIPDVPDPDALPSLAEVAARHASVGTGAREISRVIEQRLLEDPFAPEPKTPPQTQLRVWMRVAGQLPDDPSVHSAALTFASDLTLLSAGLARVGGGWGGRYVGASLDHAVWFHAPMRADEWFLYETDSPAASAGRALCLGNVWTADGAHVATVAQEGLIRALED